MINRVAIIGAGPSGCALACFLAERNIECVVFDDEKKPDLIVGESLVPAVIPILRRLGIEERVAEISHIKRGAALRLGRQHSGNDFRVDFAFGEIGKENPGYAYNIPRPQFDALVRERAEELGITFISKRAKIEKTDDNERDIQLTAESLADADLTRNTQPDILIDATGRSRLFSRTLKIAAKRGPRNDIAQFAHFNNFESNSHLEGQIVISALECGWSWQIPLPGKTSVGVVMNKDTANSYGSTAEERLESAIEHNPALKLAGAKRECCSAVMTYSNYQLMSERAHGKGWALVGDALGFVDPMLSPGVFMALKSATLLDELIFSEQQIDQELQFKEYYSRFQDIHAYWSRLIEYFYNGRILKMSEMRELIRSHKKDMNINNISEPMISKSLSRLVSGVAIDTEEDYEVLHKTSGFLTSKDEQLSKYEIRSALQENASKVA